MYDIKVFPRSETVTRPSPVFIHIQPDGWVQYLDHMGSDETVIESARTSTGRSFISWEPYEKCEKCGCIVSRDVHDLKCGGATKKFPRGDLGILEYLWKNHHCYDDATEVLTEDGFRPWSVVEPLTKLGVWDDEVGSLRYEAPHRIVAFDYDGPMYRVEHGGVDLLVTPSHKMFVKTKVWNGSQMVWEPAYQLKAADELGDRAMVRYSKIAPYEAPYFSGEGFPACDDPSALLSLVGFFIGDGNATDSRANGITFNIRKSRKLIYLFALCERLGWSCRRLGGGEGACVVTAPGITKLFFDLFYDENQHKRIPPFLRRLNREDSTALLDGLRNSDGSGKRGAWAFSTTVPAVAEAMQIVALHAGEAAHFYQHTDGTDTQLPSWIVMMLSRMREPVVNQSRRNTSIVPYRGRVFCAETRTGVLVVRRNGKIVLCGNSTPFEMPVVRFLIKAPIFYWRQRHRHRAASYNEQSARYMQLPNTFYFPEPEEVCKQSKTNKQGSAEQIAPNEADRFIMGMRGEQQAAYTMYEERIKDGIANETARMNLPVSIYSVGIVQTNLRMDLHHLGLRDDEHAQGLTQQYARAEAAFVKALFPRTYAAYEEFTKYAVTFSRTEMETVKECIEHYVGSGDISPTFHASAVKLMERFK